MVVPDRKKDNRKLNKIIMYVAYANSPQYCQEHSQSLVVCVLLALLLGDKQKNVQ